MMVQYLTQCEDGYMEWYLTTSHPRIIQPIFESSDARVSFDARVSEDEVLADDVAPPPPPPDTDD